MSKLMDQKFNDQIIETKLEIKIGTTSISPVGSGVTPMTSDMRLSTWESEFVNYSA